MRRVIVPTNAHGGAPLPAVSSHPESDAPTGRRVLIVEESGESREVLRTVLERRGMQIYEARGARQGLALARHHHPDVIVLDLDSESAQDAAIQQGYNNESRDHRSSLLVLGKARQYASSIPNDRVLSKPYHYGPLILKIEQLVAAVERTAR